MLPAPVNGSRKEEMQGTIRSSGFRIAGVMIASSADTAGKMEIMYGSDESPAEGSGRPSDKPVINRVCLIRNNVQ